ncbi:MAG: MOSC N-terminal beta barrel domain-containing protein [Pseudomonadota bacterium]
MKLSQIFVYPIKSCQGLNLTSAELGEFGIQGDRRWMLVDEDGLFISQRKNPELAHIQVIDSKGQLIIQHPDTESRLYLEKQLPPQTIRSSVTVWKDTLKLKTYSDSVSEWFSRLLNRRVRLVVQEDQDHRKTQCQSSNVSLADGYPLLVATEASLKEINGQLTTSTDWRNYRPNLVIDGDTLKPHVEDTWQRLQIGDQVIIRMTTPCARCLLTTVDPDKGERRPDQEPLKTLAKYRKQGGKVNFGMNAVIERGGVINRHDAIVLLD